MLTIALTSMKDLVRCGTSAVLEEQEMSRRREDASATYHSGMISSQVFDSNVFIRNRGKSYDSGLHSDSDSDMSDSSSINGGFSDDENGRQLTNGFHEDNGFNKQSHKRKNGMVNGYGNNHHGPKSPRRVSVTPAALHDEKVYNFCRSLIRRMGRGK